MARTGRTAVDCPTASLERIATVRRLPLRPRYLFGLVVALLPMTTALGQAPAPDASTSLARYVPREDLYFYLEYEGLDAHASAWKKSVAYKVLNNTPAGAMIEEVVAQVLEKKLKVASGAARVGLFKHMARSGFLLAAGKKADDPLPSYVVLVFRGGFANKDIRQLMAQTLGSLAAPETKAKPVVRAGHKIYSGTGKSPAMASYSWWVEESKKEDIVLTWPNPESADAILETLDGKRENAVDHPLRADLFRGVKGFEPTGVAFVDPKVAFASMGQYGLDTVTRFDVRWGFQEDALQAVLRIASPSPRKGILASFEGATFDKGALLPMPETVAGFTALAIDPKSAFDEVIAGAGAASPGAAAQINAAIDKVQGTGKFRLRDDLIGHLGPKMAFYTIPTSGSSAASNAPPALAAMMTMAGLGQVPKGVALFEVDDSEAFGRALDEMMLVVNREMRTSLAQPKDNKEPAAPRPEGEGRGRPVAMVYPEFRLFPGTIKTYIFSVPPELSKAYPPSMRPSIRVGSKLVAFALTSDAARDAMEAKGSWNPPADLAGAFALLPEKMKMLQVGDNRGRIATTLASLPAKVQVLANSPLFNPPAPGSPPPATPPAAAAGSAPGSGSLRGEFAVGGPARAPGSGNDSGSGAAPGGPPGTAGNAATGPTSVVIQVAPGKLPSADTVKGMLFPSMAVVEVDDDEIRLVSRVAFPDISWLSLAPVVSLFANPAGLALPGAAANPDGPPPAAPEGNFGVDRRGGR